MQTKHLREKVKVILIKKFGDRYEDVPVKAREHLFNVVAGKIVIEFEKRLSTRKVVEKNLKNKK